ncbi:TPA_asm: P4 [Erysimum trirhavirus 1]|nr:TPA_asm: P4 [Erysimum trirhavirus 1]
MFKELVFVVYSLYRIKNYLNISMGVMYHVLSFLIERFGEHTLLVVDLAIILLVVHYIVNLRKLARLIRYITMMNDPLVAGRVNPQPMAFHMAME